MLRKWSFVPTIVVLFLVSCSPDAVVSPELENPSFAIVDAAHGGLDHFYFLPPMVKQPVFEGVFDGSLEPVVRITENGSRLVDLTPVVSTVDEHYHVNWVTSDFELDPAKTYSVVVLLNGQELGYVDLVVGLTGKELKNVNTDDFVPLKDGRTLPIKFRLEEGVLPPVLSTMVFTSYRDESLEIYTMLSDGSEQTRLTSNGVNDQQPALSPDGTKIAYRWLVDFDGEIFIMNIDGSERTQVTSDGCWDYNPAWSPDMSKIAYICGVGEGNNNIFVTNVDGTGTVQLTFDGAWNNNPNWSPDGSRIVFSSNRVGGTHDIYVMNSADGTNVVQLVNTVAYERAPTWSPDGNRIAFMSNRDGNNEIYVMDADGSNQTRLTVDAGVDEDPSWSPDGSRIAFASDRDGDYELYVMNADGSNVTQLTVNTWYDGEISWGSN